MIKLPKDLEQLLDERIAKEEQETKKAYLGFVDVINKYISIIDKYKEQALVATEEQKQQLRTECIRETNALSQRLDKAMELLEAGKIPTASCALFKEYLNKNRQMLTNNGINVAAIENRINNVAPYIKQNYSVEQDINIILSNREADNRRAYSNSDIKIDPISQKKYFNFDMVTLSNYAFNKANRKVEQVVDGKVTKASYFSGKNSLYAYKDYFNLLLEKNPEIVKNIIQEMPLAELNVVFKGRVDIDYANKTSCNSNCDRYLQDAKTGEIIKEKGILTTIMISIQDVNERLSREILKGEFNMDLIMNPKATHESTLEQVSSSDPDFKFVGESEYVELQTKLEKIDKYDVGNPGTLQYKPSKHNTYMKYIEEGASVIHVDKELCSDKFNGGDSYLKEKYTFFSINDIYKQLEKYPQFITNGNKKTNEIKENTENTYGGKTAVVIDVKGLQEVSGQCLYIDAEFNEALLAIKSITHEYLDNAVNHQKEYIAELKDRNDVGLLENIFNSIKDDKSLYGEKYVDDLGKYIEQQKNLSFILGSSFSIYDSQPKQEKSSVIDLGQSNKTLDSVLNNAKARKEQKQQTCSISKNKDIER